MSRLSDIDRRSGIVALVILATALAAALALVMPRYNRAFCGDSVIHLVYARNFANGHPFEFNPGEKSFGCTAPAWLMLQTLCYELFPKQAPQMCSLQAVLIYLTCVFLAAGAAWQLGMGPVASALAALIWVIAAGNAAANWAAASMETAFCLALVFASIWLFALLCRSNRPKPAALIGLGALMGLLPLARPEAVIYCVCLGGGLACSKRKAGEPWKKWLVVMLLVAAAVALPYYVYQFAHTGKLVPDSGRSRLIYARNFALSLGPLRLSESLLVEVATSWLLLVLVGFGAYAVSVRRNDVVMRALAAAFLANLCFWSLFFPMRMPFYAERYWQVAWPPLVLLGCLGFRDWLAKSQLGRRARWCLLAALPILLACSFRNEWSLSCIRPKCDLDRAGEARLCRAIERIIPPGATLLTLEVQKGYMLDRRILSLDGIVDGKAIPYLESGSDLVGFLKRYRPDYMYASTLWLGRREFRTSVVDQIAAVCRLVTSGAVSTSKPVSLSMGDWRFNCAFSDGMAEASIVGTGIRISFPIVPDPSTLCDGAPLVKLTYDESE